MPEIIVLNLLSPCTIFIIVDILSDNYLLYALATELESYNYESELACVCKKSCVYLCLLFLYIHVLF